MCESSAYLMKDGSDGELILEDVVLMKPQGDKIVLTSILGEQKEISADIDHIDLLHHKIMLRPRG